MSTPPNGESALQSALRYAERGWQVFPVYGVNGVGQCGCAAGVACKNAGKHPLTEHGHKDATDDVEQIKAWWAQWPVANIAIRTGDESGLWVLDPDQRDGGVEQLAQLEADHGALTAPRVRTGGGGFHIYFAWDSGLTIRSRTDVLPGIDVRGDGGYVVAPGSTHASGNPYEWIGELPARALPQAPAWLLAIVCADRAPAPPVMVRQVLVEPRDLQHAEVEKIQSALSAIPNDERETWLRVGMALHSTRAREAREMWDRWSKSSEKFDAADQDKTWRSFTHDRQNDIGLPTLFKLAGDRGWKPPSVQGKASASKKKPIPDFAPFPTDALPKSARALVEQGAASIGCSSSFIALPLLSVCASFIGNTRRIELKFGWSEPSIVWSSILGESGTQKSPAVELVLQPVRSLEEAAQREYEAAFKRWQVEHLQYEKRLAAWKKQKKKKLEEEGAFDDDPPLPPPPPVLKRLSCSDTTVEALAPILCARWRGVLMVRDELSGWLLSFNQYRKGLGGDTAAWLEFFGGRGVRIDRKTGIPRSIYIPRAAVSICGGIQPGALAGAIGRDRFNDGMMARIVFAYPPRKVARWSEAVVSDLVVNDYADMLRELAGLEPRDTAEGPQPQIVQLSAEAKDLWIKFHDENSGEQESLGGDLAAAWSKLTGYAARFALIIHQIRLAEGEPSVDAFRVDAWSMESGIRLSRWFEREAERVYAMLREDEAERTLRQRCEVINRDHDGAVTARDWQKRNSRRTAEESQAELQELVDQGWATWRERRAGPTGGRPTTECAVIQQGPAKSREKGVSDSEPRPAAPEECGEVLGCGFRGAEGQTKTIGLPDPLEADSIPAVVSEAPALHPETLVGSEVALKSRTDPAPHNPQPKTPTEGETSAFVCASNDEHREPETPASSELDPPAKPCRHCGGPSYWRLPLDRSWACESCRPCRSTNPGVVRVSVEEKPRG